MNASEYVTDEARYAEQAEDMSGVHGPAQAGAAPYPLYGIQGLGQQDEAQPPFWKKPTFCYTVGAVAGFGAAWAFFGWFKPKYLKKNPGKKKAKKAE
jgi:hypothetical protein